MEKLFFLEEISWKEERMERWYSLGFPAFLCCLVQEVKDKCVVFIITRRQSFREFFPFTSIRFSCCVVFFVALLVSLTDLHVPNKFVRSLRKKFLRVYHVRIKEAGVCTYRWKKVVRKMLSTKISWERQDVPWVKMSLFQFLLTTFL